MLNQKMNFIRIFRTGFMFGVLFLLSQNTFAQKNNIKLSVHAPFTLDLGYERSLDLQHSLLINFQASVYNTSGGFFPDGEKLRVNIGHRKYLNNSKTLNGLYFGQYLGLARSAASGKEYTGRKTGYFLFTEFTYDSYARGNAELMTGSLGLNVGYQKRWKNFNFDTGIALDYNTPLSNKKGIELDNGKMLDFPNHIKGFQPSFYVGFGIAF